MAYAKHKGVQREGQRPPIKCSIQLWLRVTSMVSAVLEDMALLVSLMVSVVSYVEMITSLLYWYCYGSAFRVYDKEMIANSPMPWSVDIKCHTVRTWRQNRVHTYQAKHQVLSSNFRDDLDLGDRSSLHGCQALLAPGSSNIRVTALRSHCLLTAYGITHTP